MRPFVSCLRSARRIVTDTFRIVNDNVPGVLSCMVQRRLPSNCLHIQYSAELRGQMGNKTTSEHDHSSASRSRKK